MTRFVAAADRFVALFCKWGVIACLLALFFLLITAVAVRLVPVLSVSGYDEIVEWLFVWLTFLGALALWREGALYRVVVIESSVPAPIRRAIMIMTQILMLAFALVMVIKGAQFLRDAGETTPFLGIDKGYWYVAIPATGIVMTIYSAVGLWRAALGRAPLHAGGPVLG